MLFVRLRALWGSHLKTLDFKWDERYKRVEITPRVDDTAGAPGTWKFNQAKHFREAAAQFRVDKEWLQGVVAKFLDGGKGDETIPVPGQGVSELTITLRGRLESSGCSITDAPLTAFRLYLAVRDYPAPEPLLMWKDRAAICAVDIDGVSPPDTFAATMKPRPWFAWRTHGGGLRLIYAATPLLTADELGAVASLAVRHSHPTARVELKSDTRHPAYPRGEQHCGPVREQTGDADTAELSALFAVAECSPMKRDQWLSERGLQIGRRYPHDKCPVAPAEPGHRDPVQVCDGGIYCYVCAGKGVRLGSRHAGYFPYRALAGDYVDSTLRIAVENFTHWTHFEHVLAECCNLEGELAELVYRAALKLRHGDDPRIAQVFAAGRDLLRTEQGWTNAGGELYSKQIENIISELPACLTGEGKVSPTRVAVFANPVDLTQHGYPPLVPVWGCRIASQFLDAASVGYTKVFHTAPLRPESARELRPTYIPEHARPISEENAWQVIEEVFPGVNRDLVRLLIAARGVAEIQAAMPAFLFLSGPSASGKTGSVQLAASICGDATTAISWQRSAERVRQGVLQAKVTGSFCLLNEILKDGQRDKAGVDETLDFLLNLTPDSVSHRLYIGPVRLGWVPVVVLTDTVVPAELKQSKQIARRLIHVPLFRRVEWERPLQDSGVGMLQRFRVADLRYAEASNVILSAVVDRFFRAPRTLKDIAAELGYHALDKAPEASESEASLRAFYDAVCDAPDARGVPAGMQGRGWKVIERFLETPLTNLWRELGERKCTETAWGQLLGVPGDVELELRPSKQAGKLYVRFVVDRRSGGDYSVNREITGRESPATAQPAPAASVDWAALDAVDL